MNYIEEKCVAVNIDIQQSSTNSLLNSEISLIEKSEIDIGKHVTTSERQQLYVEINNLRLEKDLFMSKWMSIKDSNCSLGINKIRAHPDKCNMLTGVSLPVLEKLLCFLCKRAQENLLKNWVRQIKLFSA
ncbi:uncharacterized protein LOC136077955 [Hydra vulgaris]|uniref:Uncharacterized protein LOC136077955 n=1 Tax=Hydra vulgaris TaxID=6087 RepID=A0ABM4BHF5_HYDVU